MDVFGSSDFAVRALSGVLSARDAAAGLVRRAAGSPASPRRSGTSSRTPSTAPAPPSLLLFATSPYAIRYGTETRMYSLVVFLVLLFALVLARALEQPSLRRWAGVTADDGGAGVHALLDAS